MAMFNTWKVTVYAINMSNGESEVTYRAIDEKDAMIKFRDWCASYGNNPATKACEVVVLNPDGDLVRMEKIDNSKYIPAEEPVAEEE